MKLSLQLKLGQQLTMTPQLQQAIRLLQLSTLDLQQEIQEALESNPMLELDENQDEGDAVEDSQNNVTQEEIVNSSEPNSDISSEKSAEQNAEQGSPELSDDLQELQNSDWNENEIPEELAVDSSWEDIYINTTPTSSYTNLGNEDSDFESRNSAVESLQDHLNWQLNLTPMSDSDRLIAMSIVDSIDPNGLLTSSIASIHAGLIRDLDIEEDEVLAVLHRIQQFDPIGVGYRDLSESLRLQLAHCDAECPGFTLAGKVIEGFLPQLATRDYKLIMKRLRVKEPELKAALQIILSLNPRPGSEITLSDTPYVVPDVFVKKEKKRWKVELNPDTTPSIRVNPDYAALVGRGNSGSDSAYLKENLQEARWFLKSLQSRNETLLKVASKIVEHQRGFFDYGDEAMKPLVLHDIAEAVGMHESTISRVTTQKYMHTPRGIYELKYFFSSHVSTQEGGECSSTAIRALIKKLVANENPQKPLSDSKITSLLGEQGINIARRTIAKYRESLSISPSNERKCLL
ncbi:RNA polymerase factor sigma-54 [Haliea sp. AH-315-K21]|uniref:RNA polymerase sigma-54 factor n=1 Tax=SAR86 cluster bacterium TaxID=2030880 RepID=A0A2A5CB06_9GAMM|nr:RNA polymerase factor sigma-54 [Haliea sp. AH-315-K21]PCJ40620.1 MAG: RNA polymerase factor sigma-54 [SAR86 cluster bacterium]